MFGCPKPIGVWNKPDIPYTSVVYTNICYLSHITFLYFTIDFVLFQYSWNKLIITCLSLVAYCFYSLALKMYYSLARS